MTTSDRDMTAAVAATRFGLGARPGEIAAARSDPRGWLKAQIRPEGAEQPDPALPSTADRIADFQDYQQAKKDPNALKSMLRKEYLGTADEFMARARLAAQTDGGFRERWTLFWINHFAVAANKGLMPAVVGPFEREALRPHVFGRFEDLLTASTRHPAMLVYLDQAQSAGPDSPAARRNRKLGLNENLGREIMELHTVGVDAGYQQADVTEFARALTGWSFGGPRDPDPSTRGRFIFRANLHEPGARRVMGRAYGDGGEAQARAVLRDLAAHPATARHVAVKLARHFVADDPPPALTARLEHSFRDSDGRLDQVAAALVDAPEAWSPAAAKFKTPYEFLISSWRALGAAPAAPRDIIAPLNTFGQRAFTPPSPKGWADVAGDWAAPDAIVKRMTWSEAFAAANMGDADPAQIAQNALGGRLSPVVAKAVDRAESRKEALAVLLMSPEFQRR